MWGGLAGRDHVVGWRSGIGRWEHETGRGEEGGAGSPTIYTWPDLIIKYFMKVCISYMNFFFHIVLTTRMVLLLNRLVRL